MKKRWLFVAMLFQMTCAWSQNTIFFGHYMFNPIYYNPASGSTETQGYVTFQHRSQWLGYSSSFDGSGGAPTTQMLSAVSPIRNFVISSAGIVGALDNLGPVSNFQLQIPLSKRFEMRKGVFNIGISPMIYSQTLRFDQLRFNDPSDPLNRGTTENQSRPDVNVGVMYQSDRNWYIGVSAQHLLEPGFDFNLDSLENKQTRSYATAVGFSWTWRDKFILRPVVLIRTDLQSLTFDLGAILSIGEKLWTGLSFRKDESAIIYLGYSLLKNNQLKVGYGFDYIIQNQQGKSPTSHEIFVRYNLPNFQFGGKKVIKTPRFSF